MNKSRGQNAKDYKRRSKQAQPRWLTVEHKREMSLMFWLCEQVNRLYRRRVYNVDHIYPIRSPYVCGLNVPWNLRIMKVKDNSRKGNRIELAEALEEIEEQLFIEAIGW